MELQTVDTKRRMTSETINTVAAGQLSVDPVWRDCSAARWNSLQEAAIMMKAWLQQPQASGTHAVSLS